MCFLRQMNETHIKTTKKQVEQACELLRNQITDGRLSTEGKLPSVRKLAEQTGLQRNTIWRALLDLKEERYVTTTPTGRYIVHPRFRTNRPNSKTLNTVFVGTGTLALENPFIQRVYNVLAGNQEGFNINLTLKTGTEENQISPEHLTVYDAVILAASWSFPHYDYLKTSKGLVTSLVAPLLYHLPCDVRIDEFHGGEEAGKAMCELPIQRAVLLGESQHAPDR